MQCTAALWIALSEAIIVKADEDLVVDVTTITPGLLMKLQTILVLVIHHSGGWEEQSLRAHTSPADCGFPLRVRMRDRGGLVASRAIVGGVI